jgi:hypothetical protein
MAKSFLCRRTDEGAAVMEDAIEYLRQCLDNNEKRFGRLSLETWKALLTLAVAYSAAEDFKKVKQLLAPSVSASKGERETDPKLMLWAYTLLVDAYLRLGLIPEGMELSLEGRAIAKGIGCSAPDQLLESLVQKSKELQAEGSVKRHQRGFTVSLLTLCFFVSHGFEKSGTEAHLKTELQILFQSYGVCDKDWEWALKHAHLTKYDFVGLLSVLLHHSGLVPAKLETILRRKPRVIEVR